MHCHLLTLTGNSAFKINRTLIALGRQRVCYEKVIRLVVRFKLRVNIIVQHANVHSQVLEL